MDEHQLEKQEGTNEVIKWKNGIMVLLLFAAPLTLAPLDFTLYNILSVGSLSQLTVTGTVPIITAASRKARSSTQLPVKKWTCASPHDSPNRWLITHAARLASCQN